MKNMLHVVAFAIGVQSVAVGATTYRIEFDNVSGVLAQSGDALTSNLEPLIDEEGKLTFVFELDEESQQLASLSFSGSFLPQTESLDRTWKSNVEILHKLNPAQSRRDLVATDDGGFSSVFAMNRQGATLTIHAEQSQEVVYASGGEMLRPSFDFPIQLEYEHGDLSSVAISLDSTPYRTRKSGVTDELGTPTFGWQATTLRGTPTVVPESCSRTALQLSVLIVFAYLRRRAMVRK